MLYCAKILDSQKIPPCGHKTNKASLQVRVHCSAREDQEAQQLCYSVRGVTATKNGDFSYQDTELNTLVVGTSPSWFAAKTPVTHVEWMKTSGIGPGPTLSQANCERASGSSKDTRTVKSAGASFFSSIEVRSSSRSTRLK